MAPHPKGKSQHGNGKDPEQSKPEGRIAEKSSKIKKTKLSPLPKSESQNKKQPNESPRRRSTDALATKTGWARLQRRRRQTAPDHLPVRQKAPLTLMEKKAESKLVLQKFILPCPKDFKIPLIPRIEEKEQAIETIPAEDDDTPSLQKPCCSKNLKPVESEMKKSRPRSVSDADAYDGESSEDEDILLICVDEDTSCLTGPIPHFNLNAFSS